MIAAVVVLETGRLRRSRLPRRERRLLARVAGSVDVPAGRPLVRQGAPADAFFVIERGRASVERDDRRVAELAEGDFFGEVALLNGGARNASVVAATELRVRVIPRREFGAAMRRLPTLARSVRDAAVERLGPAPAAA